MQRRRKRARAGAKLQVTQINEISCGISSFLLKFIHQKCTKFHKNSSDISFVSYHLWFFLSSNILHNLEEMKFQIGCQSMHSTHETIKQVNLTDVLKNFDISFCLTIPQFYSKDLFLVLLLLLLFLWLY